MKSTVSRVIFLFCLCTFPSTYLLSELGQVITPPEGTPSTLNLGKVFESCPIIYTILIALSIGACVLWVYSLFTLRLKDMMPEDFTHNLRQQISEKHFEEALEFCEREKNFASNIIASGLSARNHGSQVVMDTIQAEGQRAGNKIWQRIGLLNDIAVIAPMFGLLGTVLGLFFAFYDTSNTTDNLATIFDGLGIAIGTTVLGLIVAIMAMVFYTTLKYRVVNLLNTIENESFAIVNMIQIDEKK